MFTTALMMLQLGGPGGQTGMFRFFLQAGPMAKFILAALALFSIGSWAIIFGKLVQFRRADRQSEKFLEVFRRSQRFSEVNAQAGKLGASPLVGIFQAGYAEIDAQIKSSPDPDRPGEKRSYRISSVSALERTLTRAVNVELQGVTRWLGFLATTAAATPFIGLFGTVWGIMTAFAQIANTGSTSITAVAPGISEALVNTAAGLVAAVPALIAYNNFNGRVRVSRSEMRDFALEFMNLAERHFT